MLGEAFYTQFKDNYLIKCTDKDVNEDWLSYLDFRDYEAYRNDVIDFNPDYLFHLGAYTDLEYCEKNSDDTYKTNTLSVENAVWIANKLNIPLLYISTAGIFDGKKNLYDDWDLPNPLGVYARSKYMGERYVCENSKRFLVCRAGWMMGSGPKKDKKFIQKLMKQLKNGAKELFIVDDKLSMSHSLENRVPFMDNDLVDFAMKCPARYKIKNLSANQNLDENDLKKKSKYFQRTNDGKKVLRYAMKNILPKDVINRKKQGFSAPDETWFRSESLVFLKESISI